VRACPNPPFTPPASPFRLPHFTQVLLHARTVSFTQGGTLPGVDALLSAWRPGEEGGTAVYDIVSGAVNPSGRLPQAWPLSVGQVNGPASPYLYPFQGDHQWEDYTDASSAPLFPFGWGLSYSTWALSSPTASRSANGSSFELGVTVHNSAGARGPARDGALTVFVFLEDVVCSVVRVASVQLVAFEKTLVPGGGSARVSLTVPTSSMAVWLEERRDFVLEKGDFIFYFSTSGPGQGNAFPPGTQTVRVTV
jgi:beta-glucosidase